MTDEQKNKLRESSKKSIPGLVSSIINPQESGDRRSAILDLLMRRPYLTGVGGALSLGYAPALGAQLRGESTLFHGTTASAVPSILSTGLRQEYAGGAGRLNAWLQANTLMNVVEDTVKKPIPEAVRREFILHSGATILTSKLSGQRVPVSDILINKAKKVAIELGMNPEDAKILRERLNEAGRRIYFGSNASSVKFYSGTTSEIEAAAKKAMEAKGKDKFLRAARNLPSVLVGGVDKVIRREIIDPLSTYVQIKRAPTSVVTTAEEAAELVRHALAKDPGLGAVLKTTVPAKTMGVFKDFPVIGHMIATNKGVQDMLADASFQTYSPGRDISVGQNVPPENVREVYLVNREGGIGKVIKIEEAVGPKISPTLRGAGKAIFPALMTFAGLSLLSKAITGKSLLANLGGEEKTSAISFSTLQALKSAAKAGLIFGGLGAATAVPTYLAYRATRKEREEMGPLKTKAVTTAVTIPSAYAAALSPLVSAGVARTADPSSALMSLVGSLGASMPVNQAIAHPALSEELRLHGIDSSILGQIIPKSEKINEKVMEHPEESSLALTIGVPTAIAATAAYTARKHYWSLLSSAMSGLRQLAREANPRVWIPAAALGAAVPVGVSSAASYFLPKLLAKRHRREKDRVSSTT